MKHQIRRFIWFLLHPLLTRLGYRAEANENRSVFYILNKTQELKRDL